MSIRSNAMPYRGNISRELDDVLRRNGMRAQIGVDGDKYVLYVQGHDSPLLKYEISEQQMRALSEGGTNFSNKKAYNTFNSIVGGHFDIPSSYVAARNAYGRVAMGLHGYREGIYGTGRGIPLPYHAFGPGFLGWAPRDPSGIHLRRVGGAAMVAGGTMLVPEHSDGRLRPGELRSGSYGYYFRGQSKAADVNDGAQATNGRIIDELEALNGGFIPVNQPTSSTEPVRSTAPALPYKEQIASEVYFSNEKWQDVLSSHGIIIDANDGRMTIQSSKATDLHYNLTPDELKIITSNSLSDSSVQQRLDIINDVIKGDFKDRITADMLDSRERISIGLTLTGERRIENQALVRSNSVQGVSVTADEVRQSLFDTRDPEKGYVNMQVGTDERKGWYREGRHGREVEVSELMVEKVHYPNGTEPDINDRTKGIVLLPDRNMDLEQGKPGQYKSDEDLVKDGGQIKYRMTAVINGEAVTHEISRKQYEKFLSVDDYQRQRMMSRIFDEVDMKTRPEARQGFNLPAFLAAGLVAAREATHLGAGIAQDIDRIRHPGPRPELYQEAHGTVHMLHKPDIESPQELAERAYREGVQTGIDYGGRGR